MGFLDLFQHRSLASVRMQENADQNNCEFGHVLRNRKGWKGRKADLIIFVEKALIENFILRAMKNWLEC